MVFNSGKKGYHNSIEHDKKGRESMGRYGEVRIKLPYLLERSGLSKNKLGHQAELQRTQLNRYCRNEVTRLDTDVLARLCAALHCDIADLLEYVPPQEQGVRAEAPP